MKKLQILLLLLIVLLGTLLRFVNLSTIPVGFHLDEAITADNAKFILYTGRDTNNVFLPLQTEVFHDYNPTGYTYLTILPIALGGFTELSTRLPGALLGTLTILAIFLFIYVLFEAIPIALIGAALFAISPWSIMLSRSSEQSAAALFFVVFGFALLLLSIKKEHIGYLVGAIIILALSYLMYFTPRVFVPLFFFSFFLPWKYWWKKRNKLFAKLLFASFIVLCVLSLFLILGLEGGENRFKQVSIFTSPETRLIKEEQIREDGISDAPVMITRFFHNKITAYGYTYVSNYLQYFSPEFLFMKGGLPNWFSIPQMGLFYLIEAPFILLGLLRLCMERKKWLYLLFVWLLLAPMTAAVTFDDIPNVRRSFLLVPVLQAFAAYGIVVFFKMLPRKIKKVAGIFLFSIFIYSFAYFIDAYFVHAQVHKNWYRGAHFGEMIQKVKQVYDKYDHIVITKSNGGIYSEILFYMNYDPQTYLNEGATKDALYTGFGKFYFVPGLCPASNKDPRTPKGKNLYVERGECPRTLGQQEYIKRQDGSKLFHLVYE